MIFEFEADGFVRREENVDKDTIVNFINQMIPNGKSFCILTADDESYVQCAGAKSKLTIEYRKYTSKSFSHYVLSRQPIEDENISVRYSGGYITVKKNEALTSKDAVYIFERFLNTQHLPEEYNLRETTNIFSN
ncbi:hypothetical protein [Clostridium omnivorum]|uniref:Uncharacterized protein n=1 Tax=Clostridium omnivorum TaxID=1604902 RepID=A0ABQ5N5V8_9CLOT|nr:hypothetical protein [Clostridium sp. E14]GLC30615.1 hypothetical protein bsdE14_20250 [Clostridium sp. E14]